MLITYKGYGFALIGLTEAQSLVKSFNLTESVLW